MLRESCVDEGEPLRSPLSTSPTSSRLSTRSFRRPDRTRRTIVCLLILFVIALAVFLSFLTGKWMADDDTRRGNGTSKRGSNPEYIYVVTPLESSQSNPQLTTPARTNTVTQQSIILPTSPPRVAERLIPLPHSSPNLSLHDVYPPSTESEDILFQFHSTFPSQIGNSLLVPLPTHILPTHYQLLLDITRFEEDKFIRGNLSIQLNSYGNSTDDEILFHIGPRVNIERIRITREGKRVYPKTIKREDNKKMARLILRERLQKGTYTLDIEYNTTICKEERQSGVHCYSVKTGNNSQMSAFTTKFEPAFARAFIPCWDQPDIKATFNISVLHHAKYTVLSNMPTLEGSIRQGGGANPTIANRIVMTSFQETPPMSSYLLAFAVGDFVPLEMRTERNIPLTVWTHREDFLSARFAANFSPIMFDRHVELLEVPYPLPKMDFVAAHSFPVGGMENWGLVIYDAQVLLMDQEMEDNVNMTVDRRYKEYKIEKIITHELAHQWFGNLVTMSDWSDLWLNEGFATFLGFDLLQQDHPKLTDHEYHTKLALLMRLQSGQEHRPLVRELRTEKDVEFFFSNVHLYTKGCVMVRMIRDLVSEFDFKSGVKRYLRKNAFLAVTRQSLWASLPAHADHGAEPERLDDVMEGWILNDGIPEVHLVRSYEDNMIHVVQHQANAQRHRVYLKKDEGNSSHANKEVGGPKGSHNNVRARRNVEETTPFDDNLFEDMPQEWRKLIPKPKHNKKRKKTPHPLPTRPEPDVLIESRREELRQPRRAREPSDLWSIPFSYMFGSVKSTEGQVVRQFWLKNRSISFADVELASSQPVLANPEWQYPYRVNYDHTNWKMIARWLHQSHLDVPAKSRMQLILDAEMFLSESEYPHLYVYMIGYLSEESDLSVVLVGLSAVYRLVSQWGGSDVNTPLLVYLAPVVAQFDKLLNESQKDPELAALWLIEPERLAQLYQLRCATNLPSCVHDEKVGDAERRQILKEIREEMLSDTLLWLANPSKYDSEDVHQEITAACHYLFTNSAEKEVSLLAKELNSKGHSWATSIQLAACTQNEEMAKMAAKQVVETKNAAVYASSLQSDFSLHYNPRFRRALWNQMGKLSVKERELIFGGIGDVQPASKIMVHSVRTDEELRQLRSIRSVWDGPVAVHLDFVSLKMEWRDKMARGVMKDFFNGDAFI